MIIREIKIIKFILNKKEGLFWPIILVRGLLRGRSLYKKTYWAKDKGAESKFVKRISILAGIYLNLIEKIGEVEAYQIMEEIIVPISFEEQVVHAEDIHISEVKNPLKRYELFVKRMETYGIGQFNRRMNVIQTEEKIHFNITRCVLHDFYTELGIPELTRLICKVDKIFFNKYFPEYNFHRGSSWKNTVAYGKDHCKFILERKY